MKQTLFPGLVPVLAALLIAPGRDLSPRYEANTAYRTVRTSTFELETTAVEIERNGESVEGRNRSGGSSATTKEVVTVDHVLEVDAGQPTVVRRVFEELSGEASRADETVPLESPFDGAVLELALDGAGEIVYDVVEGDVDSDLDILRLSSALDALLSVAGAKPGAEWDVSGEDLLHALGIDLDAHAWSAPEFEERSGAGRRGSRGSRSEVAYLSEADWNASAEWTEDTDEVDGVDCDLVRIEASGSSDTDAGQSRGEDGSSAEVEMIVEIELEATLAFDRERGRALRLEVEALVTIESTTEFERGDTTMRISRSMEGVLEATTTVTDAEE